jgi:hypothetical protein
LSRSTIAQKVGEMRTDRAEQPHNRILEVFEREQSTLAAVGEPAGALAVGSTVPDVKLIDPEGVPTLPWPTTTILDRGRALRWIDVHPDYSTRSEAADIVAALDALNL